MYVMVQLTLNENSCQNAGIATPRRPMHEASLEDTKQLFDVNILAPFLCCQEAIKIMMAQSPQGGRFALSVCSKTIAHR